MKIKVKRLKGKPVAQKIKIGLKSRIQNLESKPKLAIVLVGDDPASVIFTNRKKEFGAEIGVPVDIHRFPPNIDEQELKSNLLTLNSDQLISGIIVQLPLPNHLNPHDLLDLINPTKDVDGLTSANQNSDNPIFYPAGAEAVMEILKFYDIKITGKKAAVVGQSNLAGKPIAKLLKNAGANVATADIDTPDLKSVTSNADIVVSAVGKPGLITGNLVKGGVVLIDVGTALVGGELKGDMDATALEKASAATSVPGGVGPVTVACLFQNLLKPMTH